MRMIRRTDAPEQLTEEVKAELTQKFKENKKNAVWNKPYIRNGLLEMSSNKCCYCEEFVNDGCSEMHVDHFHDKDTYPDEVVKWENLLPSCSHCNKKKSTHDTYQEPIVNPTIDNPKDIFFMQNYRYVAYDRNPNSLGKISIGVLGINDSEEKVKLRFLIGNKLNDELDKLYEDAFELGGTILTNTRKRNKVLSGCLNNLRLCTKVSRFGASMATTLQGNNAYQDLRKFLMEYNLWSEEMEQLHKESLEICLCKKDTN